MDIFSKPKINQVQMAWINITERCNNRCVWCYAKNSLHERTAIIPFLKIVKMLRNLKKIGVKRCCLIGGEPTLHPDIIKIFTTGEKIGITISVISNGRLFSDINFCKKFIKNGLKEGQIALSMHASSLKDSEKLTRSKKYFSEFSQGLNNLISLGIVPKVNITISKLTAKKIPTMMLWLKKQGLNEVAFNFAAPAVSVNSFDDSFVLPLDEYVDQIYKIYEYGKKIEIKPIFVFTIPFCALPKDMLKKLINDGHMVSGCHIRTGTSILFNINGDLVSCNHLLDVPMENKLNINKIFKENRFQEFWSSKSILSMRKEACSYRLEECKNCEYLSECGGGNCPIIWIKDKPRKYIDGWKKKEVKINEH